MVPGSVIRQSAAKARDAIGVGLSCVVLCAAAFLLERQVFTQAYADAAWSVQTQRAAVTELRESEAVAAVVARAAGEYGAPFWRERLVAEDKRLKAAVERAAVASVPVDTARFAAAASLEQEILMALANARLERARQIVRSSSYAQAVQDRRASVETTLQSVEASAAARLAGVGRGGFVGLLGVIALVVVGSVLLMSRFRREVAAARDAFLDADDRLSDLALIDPLTGATSRGAFRVEMEQACVRAKSNSGALYLIIVDFDNFAAVNERLGHLDGDALLRKAATRMRAQLRPGESFARLAGAQFGVLAASVDESLHAVTRARDFRRVLAAAYRIGGRDVIVDATAGVAGYSQAGGGADGLMRAATAALRHAKVHARGAVSAFNADIVEALDERGRLAEDLAAAIEAGGVSPVFQPTVSLDSDDVVDFEMLARWSHPALGAVAPQVFIALAEENGLADALFFSVLEQAFVAAKTWPDHVTLRVNVTPRQLASSDFAAQILAAATRAGWPAGRLMIDITEAALIADFAAARRTLASLRNLGVRVALDDFGAGYASLAYVADVAFDALKIDRAFVRTLHDSETSRRIVAAIAGLTHSLGVTIVAEGVESAHDAEALAALGCRLGQGFWFTRPLAADAIAAFLAARQTSDHKGMRRSA